MSFDADAPGRLVDFRDRLLECDAITVSLGLATGDLHYPSIALADVDLPAAVLYEADYAAERHAGGGEVFARGTVGLCLYLPATGDVAFTVAQAERIGQDLVDQLVGWTEEGLCILRARRERASKPRRVAKAAAGDEFGRAYITIRVDADWEG